MIVYRTGQCCTMLDESKINLCLHLSEIAYQRSTLRVGECECYVLQEKNAQYVSFRGTEAKIVTKGGWADVLRDLRAFPWHSARLGGWSHSGFYKGAKGVVDSGLFGILRRDTPIYFTGHSLGGALALNAACMMYTMGFNVCGVVTFGSPRTFTKGTANRWLGEVPIKQYSNEKDLVTKMPMRFFGYRHVNEIKTGLEKGHSLKHYQEVFRDGRPNT